MDHLYAGKVLTQHFRAQQWNPDELVIVSPDEGSIKRAVAHMKRLGGSLAIVDKRRENSYVTKQENIIGGPVEGKICLMFDDMISTAGSICGAAELVKRYGAREIHVAVTHGVFAGKAIERLGNLAAAAANAGDVAKAMVYADSINRIQSAGCSQ